MLNLQERDHKFLKWAIRLAKKSPKLNTRYRVGAIIVSNAGKVIGRGYTAETSVNNHAEEEAVLSAKRGGFATSGSTIYVSMEPCGRRSSKKKSCANLIIQNGIKRMVYAQSEPAIFVAKTTGRNKLRKGGVRVRRHSDLAPLSFKLNLHILKQYA